MFLCAQKYGLFEGSEICHFCVPFWESQIDVFWPKKEASESSCLHTSANTSRSLLFFFFGKIIPAVQQHFCVSFIFRFTGFDASIGANRALLRIHIPIETGCNTDDASFPRLLVKSAPKVAPEAAPPNAEFDPPNPR